MRLSAHGRVAPQIEMLTDWRVRSAFNSRRRLALSANPQFRDGFIVLFDPRAKPGHSETRYRYYFIFLIHCHSRVCVNIVVF